MGLFSKNQEVMADNIYVNSVKPNLKKDGFTHIVMINSFSKWLNQNFECETKYTTQIDTILTSMQQEGFEIIDVKFNSIQGQGITGQMEGFHTLITYR